MAVLEAIKANPGPAPLLIEADSQYAIRCSSEWLPGWKRKGWRTASGGQIKNLDLVQQIDAELNARTGPVRFRWVRGHIGHKFNARADELAGIAARDWASGRGAVSVTGVLVSDIPPDDDSAAGATVESQQAPLEPPHSARGSIETGSLATGSKAPAFSTPPQPTKSATTGLANAGPQSWETESLVRQIFASVNNDGAAGQRRTRRRLIQDTLF
jgi:ribonuclease HI